MRNLPPGKTWPLCLTWIVMAAASVSPLAAQSPTGAGEDSPPAASSQLSNSQKQLFRDYERFEKALFDVAEQIRRKDPEQADILYRARSKSREDNILSEMQVIAELLESSKTPDGVKPAQYGPAVDRQEDVLARMESILKLLQTLDARQQNADDIKRVEEWLKMVTRNIAGQKDVRADTLRDREPGPLSEAQQKVADQARELADQIDRHDEQQRQEQSDRNDADANDSPQSPGKSESPEDSQEGGKSSPENGDQKQGENSESQPDEQSPNGDKTEQDPATEDPSTDNSSTEKGEQSQSSEKSESGEQSQQSEQSQSGEQSQQGEKSQQGSQSQQSQQSQSGQQQDQQQQQTPGREQLEQARRQMQKAIEDLQKKQLKDAVEDQDAAISKLEELKAELERILRQLREEEKETYLTLLEARFQNMLKRQLHINSETTRIEEIPEDAKLQQNYAAQTASVRKEQEENFIDSQKALNLLLEEGSSVSFPEAVQQMNKNMQVVINRLSKQDTGQTTQLVETLIAETLEEMISAFQQELEDQEKQDQQQAQQSPQGQQEQESLVNQIAELKMIRSLQLQINRITSQIGTENGGLTPTDPDQLDLLNDIARRQERIQKATYDLSIGRNK